ncbi:MAG: isoprenylcysteine carboxylmethyltransferase family protein [Anaerolineales bacterium]|jgi:protein-S-isoprenylcysteine O-methyltransferase Ste14
MIVLYLGFVGLLAFIMGAGILGIWLRKDPTKTNAEKFSRIMHFLYFAGLGSPFAISLFYPGLTHLDQLVGLKPLPWRAVFLAAGSMLLVPGLYFFAVSNKLLRVSGSGANAFRLTKHIVETDIYKYTRNPMSLGYYLGALGLGFISGSTLFTLYVLLGIIPAHLFFLKFFEELELELRLGESYKAYKQKTSFLIPTSPAK